MKMFSKNSDSDVASTGGKRDVTIVNAPRKRPDHVRVESHDSIWTIPLTLDEQYILGQAYEQGTDDEAAMLTAFTETIYQGDGGGTARLTVEIKPIRPGEVHLMASGSGARFKKADTLRYEDIGRTLCEWIVEAQSRKELVSDVVAALAEEKY
ncbi:hypothetical protein [Caballeronia sp. 15711]|uniref:hypothetical protein n=1 Tax=Caballeronia sp. 15711 TaxID=3391029 RepID=UPI0039E5E5F2